MVHYRRVAEPPPFFTGLFLAILFRLDTLNQSMYDLPALHLLYRCRKWLARVSAIICYDMFPPCP